jgi:hypothetical protein
MVCCRPSKFYGVLKPLKMAENVVKEALTLRPLHNELRRGNKGRPTQSSPNLMTHLKTEQERYTRLFASLSMKSLTGY